MKQKLFLLLLFFTTVGIKAQDVGFTTYNEGTQFVSIEVDDFNNRVWAATRYSNGSSIMMLDQNQDTEPTVFSTFEGVTPTGTPLKNYFIRDLAIDFSGNVWVAHYGYGNNNVVGGVEKILPDLSIKHYYAHDAGGGLQTRKVRSIIVDDNDKVWAAQYYHRLISTPPGADPNKISIWPGTLAWKSEMDFDFHVKGNTFRCAQQPDELPYPRDAFSDFMPDSALRNFQALSSDDTEVWASHWAYETGDDDCTSTHTNINNRILRYSLNGTYLGQITDTDIGFPAGSTITNICRNNDKGTWVTTYTNNSGFAVYKNGSWTIITSTDFPNVIPPNTGFNANAMWKDDDGKVYMGTNNGLIVYNGVGAVDNQGSYRLYTNYDFGANPASDNYDSYVFVDSQLMVSKNIFGGCTDPRDSSINWLATEGGIMKMKPRDGVELWHIDNHMGYAEYNDTPEEERYNLFSTKYVGKIIDASIDNIPENDMVGVTADGTKSSFIRIYTDNPQAYYNGDYKIYAGNGYDINSDAYIRQYGKFTIKTPESHNDYDYSLTQAANIAQFKYVEFTYKHPMYIEFPSLEENEIFEFLDFKVEDQTNVEILSSRIKVYMPPILLAHGVWSSINSLKDLEDYFISRGFPKSMLIKAWRTDDTAAESPHGDVNWIIPSYIDDLKDKAAKDKISAGKVTVVAHSRGGLYTRAYIEDLNVSFFGSYTKRKDINALITLDTPHFGSQGSNVTLDKRTVPYLSATNVFIDNLLDTLSGYPDFENPETITIGDIASLPSVPSADRVDNWGSRNLLVEDDTISGVVSPEDPEFIKNLNDDEHHSKLVNSGVAIHTFSAEFSACDINPIFCNDILSSQAYTIAPKKLKLAMFLASLILDGAPQGLNSVTGALFDGEPNDFIVPKSSMTGGLTDSQNTNYLATQGNYDHTGMFGHGIASSEPVLSDIFVLLTRDVNDENYFSHSGLNRTNKPTYNFLEETLDPVNQRNENIFASKILINRDPAIFENRIEGDVLNFNVYQDDVDRIMLTYESENDSRNFAYEMKSGNLSFENAVTYTIPQGYSGLLTITAYGYKNGVLGVAKSTVTLNVGIPADVTLQSIHFKIDEPVIFEQNNYNYTVIGTYSDGIDRILNNEDITFTIEEANVLSQVDANTVKGETIGSSLLKAEINGLEATVKVKVEKNYSLLETILTGFYAVPNTDESAITVNWETLREYQNATFVLETSYTAPDNFSELNQQAGNGTLDTPANFAYTDTSFGANTVIYYRLKMIDTEGNETYSPTVEVRLGTTAAVSENTLDAMALSVYPNPTKSGDVTIKFNTQLADNSGILEVYTIKGKLLTKQHLQVQQGENSFALTNSNLSSGVYLVKITTINYVKTVKLIIE